MKNNDTLKSVALQTKGLKHLAEKETLTHGEYMQLVYTDEYQTRFNTILDNLKMMEGTG